MNRFRNQTQNFFSETANVTLQNLITDHKYAQERYVQLDPVYLNFSLFEWVFVLKIHESVYTVKLFIQHSTLIWYRSGLHPNTAQRCTMSGQQPYQGASLQNTSVFQKTGGTFIIISPLSVFTVQIMWRYGNCLRQHRYCILLADKYLVFQKD